MATLLLVALIVVASLYGAEIGSKKGDTKWCIGFNCNIDTHGQTEAPSGVRVPAPAPKPDRPQEY